MQALPQPTWLLTRCKHQTVFLGQTSCDIRMIEPGRDISTTRTMTAAFRHIRTLLKYDKKLSYCCDSRSYCMQ